MARMKGTLFAHCQSDKQGVYQLVGGKMANRPPVVMCGADTIARWLLLSMLVYAMPTKADFPRKKKRLPLAEQTIVEG